MNIPEKLNLWDRIFNRYRTEIMREGRENWVKYPYRSPKIKIPYIKHFVQYKIIDRLTGSERIKKKYLN